MANFINDDGKVMSEEELSQVTGGWVVDRGPKWWQGLVQKACPYCGNIDFKIHGISEDGKTLYCTCKKCGREVDLKE